MYIVGVSLNMILPSDKVKMWHYLQSMVFLECKTFNSYLHPSHYETQYPLGNPEMLMCISPINSFSKNTFYLHYNKETGCAAYFAQWK